MGGDLMAFLTMVIVQVGYAGMNILSKLAMDSGMNPLVHVAYRQLFATIVIAPFAYFLERKTRPKMTLPIFFQIILSSIFGATLNQTLYFVGLQNSTPTIACALSNLLPAFTFILAVPFRLESVGIRRKPGQAKVLGTVICVGGAMLLSFYHGRTVIGESSIHWKYAEKMGNENSISHPNNFFLGPFLLIVSTISWAIWFIIQARMSKNYSAPYTTSALICSMASIQCGIIAFCAEPHVSSWSLKPGIRALSSFYSGTVCTALAFCLMSWCIQLKGPLYVSVFSPLQLVIVAILSWALLQEKLYEGTVVGSTLIVMGLYAVLWGKNREMNAMNFAGDGGEEKQAVKGDLEMQFPELSKNNFHTRS
ncbi:WAT1-related protein At1g09380-like [Actinidia eriantha]|uniref:WAT1-related protein At1g09380-like n=1 Tax=Actinidia eriantha TaxID=165200 RepID=UPI00258932F6|nr:WAT1-related protein At1g09380-like [Actinidia eriantha]